MSIAAKYLSTRILKNITERDTTYPRSINTFFTPTLCVFYFSPQILLEIYFDTMCCYLQTYASVARRKACFNVK